jgi:Domain of unknown function (DUF4145)
MLTQDQIPYTPPKWGLTAFNCPSCNAFSTQTKACHRRHPKEDDAPINTTLYGLATYHCRQCLEYSIWFEQKMIYPKASPAPLKHPDLPDEIHQDYDEAACILNDSPRAAAALLRLCIQKLCKHLGLAGKNINDDIGELVKRGLPLLVQQSLDIIRVNGNNAVHPGEIDLRDDTETVIRLFNLLNMITEKVISEPRQIEKMFGSLPEGVLEEIEKRASKNA